jgi:hypothetical protein
VTEQAVFVQPLHGKRRGRPSSRLLRIFARDYPDRSRRAHYYRAAVDRVWVALVESGLMPADVRTPGGRWPIPRPVMHVIGKVSRSHEDVTWLAARVLALRRQGWSTRALLHWLREGDAR